MLFYQNLNQFLSSKLGNGKEILFKDDNQRLVRREHFLALFSLSIMWSGHNSPFVTRSSCILKIVLIVSGNHPACSGESFMT